jgi:hypothetical protein
MHLPDNIVMLTLHHSKSLHHSVTLTLSKPSDVKQCVRNNKYDRKLGELFSLLNEWKRRSAASMNKENIETIPMYAVHWMKCIADRK